MGATRVVKYASISDMGGAKSCFTNADTWGELKASQADLAAFAMKLKPWVKMEGKDYELTSDRTALPEGDFTIVFLNTKNDSGRA
jgi:hypothetical protein